NTIYSERGLAHVKISSESSLSPLDRIYTEPSEIATGPLISVIVPTFQGGPLLFTALHSLLQQSWKNLEIIVVDDGSGPEYQEYLNQASSLSKKIRVFKQPANFGAYSARNLGVRKATGEFVTVHD